MFKIACATLLLGSYSATFIPSVEPGEAVITEARYRSRKVETQPIPQPIKGDPVWRCEGGKIPNQINLHFQTYQNSSVLGGLEHMVGGEMVETPFKAEYDMQGKTLIVSGMTYGPPSTPISKRALPSSALRKTSLFTVEWNHDDKWTLRFANSKVSLKCTDFTSDDPKK